MNLLIDCIQLILVSIYKHINNFSQQRETNWTGTVLKYNICHYGVYGTTFNCVVFCEIVYILMSEYTSLFSEEEVNSQIAPDIQMALSSNQCVQAIGMPYFCKIKFVIAQHYNILEEDSFPEPLYHIYCVV